MIPIALSVLAILSVATPPATTVTGLALVDGAPLPGPVTLEAALYAEPDIDPTVAVPVWPLEGPHDYGLTPLTDGRFTVSLGGDGSPPLTPTLLADHPDGVWLAVWLDGELVWPLTPVRSVPYALDAANAASLGGIPAEGFARSGLGCLDSAEFGVVAETGIDNSAALQAAIDTAALDGSRICLRAGRFEFSTTLSLPVGVSLQGMGIGEPLQGIGFLGTVLAYTGTGWGIELAGHAAGLHDLVVRQSGEPALGGVRVLADGALVESVIVRNVLAYGFVQGTGFALYAQNAGGIAYASIYDVRIRHARVGIQIAKADEGSFVNSNTFFHGVLSGGAFDVGLEVTEGNNNVFFGTVFEAVSTPLGHIRVEGDAQIRVSGARIEAASSNGEYPILYFGPGTRGSVVDGTFAGGLIVDLGDNRIDTLGNSLDYRDPGFNLLRNAAFAQVHDQAIPQWTITGSDVVETLDPQILPGHRVLKLSAAGVAKLKPATLPQAFETGKYLRLSFGAYVKAAAGTVVATFKAGDQGTTSSRPHPADGQWHFIGMTANTHGQVTLIPEFHLEGAGEVLITTPTLTFGGQRPHLEAPPITAAGGILTGTLSTGLATVGDADFSQDLRLRLPHEGNVFVVQATQTIQRINDATADRFAPGTVITLLFDTSLTVLDGAFIDLAGGAFSAVPESSLTLVSSGPGTWRELSRNLP